MISVHVWDNRDIADVLLYTGEEVKRSYQITKRAVTICLNTDLGYRVLVELSHDDIEQLSTAVKSYLANCATKRQRSGKVEGGDK